MTTELIPFQIEAQRVIQLLAKQIYQSPLALLRENTQNAFDAVRQRIASDAEFTPRIDIQLAPDRVTIFDNGIGMTPGDLKQHYWTAGSSSKNNEAARAAGVVGTFGIGAMANFGIADALTVETESAITGERTICRAEKAKLSLKEDCIEREVVATNGQPGTTIIAHIATGSHINVQQARNYIAEFVSLVAVPVYVNGELVSQRSVDEAVPVVPEAWRLNRKSEKLGDRLTADLELVLSNNADIWIKLTEIIWAQKQIPGRIVLRTGQSTLRTFRSGFGLATASVSSAYQFGGVVDLLLLEPTAGREAITVDGMQFLQSMMTEIDAFVSRYLSERDEADVSTPFMNWIIAHNRYDLCGHLRMTVVPGDRIGLLEVSERSKKAPMMLYEGADQGMINMHASEDSPLLVLARNNPRRRCEQNYLRSHAKVTLISDHPVVKERRRLSELTMAESGLAFRIQTILESDYFLTCDVDFGTISHGLPVLVEKRHERVRVTLNPDGQTVKLLLGLYDTEFTAFQSMAKDFVRNVIFPRVADYVPSSTRQGAEAFLKAIRRPREMFEYADDDLGSLPTIWDDYNEGKISLDQAVERSRTAVRSSIQVVDHAASARDVVPDVIQNEQFLQNAATEVALDLEPAPAITRQEVATSAKLLVIDDNEPALRGYRCFLAITDKAREEMGEFFLQPHRTSVVWGGQKTLFIFLHHSGQFGLYYDLQTREPVEAPAGGGSFPTATIVLKDRLFIPIPDAIRASFIPTQGERKRFEVRADILRTDSSD
ncbi:ATP-binding protein [Methylocystis sp. FS]|uniref:ATP-binding protein n=1 Tax=Methylocystis silviterrae TaxID=2743612 RepID=UPI001582112D|nr:ATP-binding protein [Methylocystis silviterrae]NUJ81670.1 ATP-binding protein [Methylocystis silviterrae]